MAKNSTAPEVATTQINQTTADSRLLSLPPVHVPRPFAGFIDFIRTQGVVGLGVGFIVGTSANTLIRSIVTNMLNPVIGWMTGGINLGQKLVCIKYGAHGKCIDTVNYGAVISELITFVAILLVVYLVVTGLKLDKLDKPKKT